jgi:hypothetical protein
MGQHVVGEAEGERRLADTLRTLDQDGVMALAGPVGLRKKVFGRLVAEEMRIFGRRNGAVENARPLFAHRADSALAVGAA